MFINALCVIFLKTFFTSQNARTKTVIFRLRFFTLFAGRMFLRYVLMGSFECGVQFRREIKECAKYQRTRESRGIIESPPRIASCDSRACTCLFISRQPGHHIEMNQSKHKAKICRRQKARENAKLLQVWVLSDWLRMWREILKPMATQHVVI